MEAAISVNFDDTRLEREDVLGVLDEIEVMFPDVELDLDEGDGVFPTPPADPYTLYLTAAASVQLVACLFPILKQKFEEMGGDVDLPNVEEVAKEYLEAHTRVSKDELDLMDRNPLGDHVSFTYKYLPDDSEHYIQINREDLTEWSYEER